MIRKMLVLAALLATAPALAQPAPPPPPAAPAMQHGGKAGHWGGAGHHRMGERMFPSMSEAGRATMREAMMAGGDRRADRGKVQAAREKMLAAGFASPMAPRIFTLVRLILIILLPTIYVVIAYLQPEPPGFLTLYLVGATMALLGLFLPNMVVQAKADRRQEAIVNGFPDCLDLILVCVEAGLGIEASMDRVGREMVHSHPLVAGLLSATTLHLRAGASKEEAYRRMADMSHTSEIRSFATLLIQSDKLGTSIASTLRVYSEEMREKRRMRAEEKAHRLPVLISIPLVVFMLPTMIGVLMLPAGIRMVREIFPLMTGG